jgi:hypothetical protein
MNRDEVQDIRAACVQRLKEVEKWEPKDLSKEFIVDLMHHYVAAIPRRNVTAKMVAQLCDLFGPEEKGGWAATHKRVAELTGKSVEAVRKARERGIRTDEVLNPLPLVISVT